MKEKEKEKDEKPEIAGVSIPSPISMHVPNIAMKSSALLAAMLLSKKFPSLLLFSVASCKTECEKLEFVCTCLEERIPIFIFLQSNEYKANVPPAYNQWFAPVKNLCAIMSVCFASSTI
jgi:hypothetical protein